MQIMIQKFVSFDVRTAHDMLTEKRGNIAATAAISNDFNHSIVKTGISTLDQVLHGGLPNGMITEVSGPSESGKTVFCMQLAVRRLLMKMKMMREQQQKPKRKNNQQTNEDGGDAMVDDDDEEAENFDEASVMSETSQVLYIDSERKFDTRFLLKITQSMCSELEFAADNEDQHVNKQRQEMMVEHVMKNIKHVEMNSQQLTSCVQYLNDTKLEEDIIENDIRLIIIDSVYFMAKSSSGEQRERNLANLAARLKQLANQFQICIVVTNNMNIIKDRLGQVVARNAEMGYMWSHAMNVRLVLDNQNIVIDKSPMCAEHSIPYHMKNGTIESAEVAAFNEQQDLYAPPSKK